MDLVLSALNKTWIIDIDGTLFKHNGYKINREELLEGVSVFFHKYQKTIWLLSSQVVMKPTGKQRLDF